VSELIGFAEDRYVYLFVIALLGIGLWAVIVERHLIKKLVGLTVFQTAIFLFFIEGSVKSDAEVPVIDDALGSDAAAYVNPLPHVLMLTGLVVAVAVLGVALALAVVIHRAYGTLDDEELTEQGADE
jgi:multicomponent Na+:H+ antiporter subunit C